MARARTMQVRPTDVFAKGCNMGEPRPRQTWPWGSALTAVMLGGVVVLAWHARAESGTPVPWPAILAAVVTGFAAFLVLRWLQNYLWGVVAGLLVPLHPLYLDRAGDLAALLTVTLQLVVLAAVVAGWRLTFRPGFAATAWILVLLVLCAGTALAWPILPQAGLTAAATGAAGLVMGAALALRRRRHRVAPFPGLWTITMAAAVGLAAPVAGLFLAPWAMHLPGWPTATAPGSAPSASDLLRAAVVLPDTAGSGLHGFTLDGLNRWCWPTPWVMLPLMAWGLWRSVRRGWKQARRDQPPLAWVLTLFTAVSLVGVALYPANAANAVLVLLASLGGLLAVFCVADLVRGLGERLVLAPPQQQNA
jgi:hypothetical protein